MSSGRPRTAGGTRSPATRAVIALVSAGALGGLPEARARMFSAGPPDDGQPPAAAPDHEDLRLAGSLELARLVDLAAARLGIRIEYDPDLLKSAVVTFRSQDPVDDPGLWMLANQFLAGRGLTTVYPPGEGDTLRIVKREQAAEAARLDDASGASAASRGVRAGFTSTAYRAQHAPPRSIAEAIKPLLSKQGGQATAMPEAGLVIISDLTPIADHALAIARVLDAPSGRIRVESHPLKNIPAQAASTMVAQLVSKRDAVAGTGLISGSGGAGPGTSSLRGTGDVLAGPDGASLIIVAPEERLDFWRELIEQVDRAEPVFTQTYSAASFTATEVTPLLTSVLAQAGSSTGVSPQARPAVIATDPLTGTLLVTGTQAQHALIEQTLTRLGSTPESARRPLKTFTLRHRNVREVIGIIERLVDVGMLDAGLGDDAMPSYDPSAPDADTRGLRPVPPPPKASGNSASATIATAPAEPPLLQGMTTGTRRVGGTGAGGSNGFKSGGRDALTLTSDEATNTLIAIGEPRVLAQLEKLLPTLDVRQPQVMIEAMLISLTDAQSMALGVELEKIEISGDTIIRLSSLFGLSSAGTGANAGSRVVGDAAGFSGVVLNPGDFSVIIRALETVNQGRSLSVPKVLVNNNQQATFNSTLQQPYASTNASDTVATTSFGGTFDAGTTITVRPQIAEGDHLVLDYQVKLSSFTGSAAGDLPPPRQENSVTSVATIPDGYTVVVGGLEAVTDGEGESRVPGIGAIPIIGELFKNRTTNRSRARFFVFLRANVMRGTAGTGFEELKYLSDRSAGEAGLLDEQSAGGWPELEPRVIR